MLAMVVMAACTSPSPSTSSPPASSGPTAHATFAIPLRPLAEGESNIARADYIGPEACGECHAPQYAAWTTSLHRVMNAKADAPKAVIGDFDKMLMENAREKGAECERHPERRRHVRADDLRARDERPGVPDP